MRLLLDTHIWLWYAAGDTRLRPPIRRLLQGGEQEVWFSAVSVWEITLLAGRRRAGLAPNVRSWLPSGLAQAGVREAPMTAEIALAAAELPWAHQDPADRLLAATAQVMGLVLVTADQQLLGVPGLAVLANA